MKRPEVTTLTTLGGIILIAMGLLFLLENLGVLRGAFALLWALVFGVGGGLFLYVFLMDRARWWAVIPGGALIGIMLMIALDQLAPDLSSEWGGAVFMACLGLAFWVVYLVAREHWWAIIPGGTMLTIALVIALSSLEGFEPGGVFLLGLGLTFGLLALVPTREGRMKWPLIPAGVLTLIGLALLFAAADILSYLLPVALILAGLYLIFRMVRGSSSQKG
ncbi:MAG: hypothetical protein N2508_00790 [Anaerolineae bacterium]|nr:hypothetical protein [Anaerolineae bacterium]